MAGCAPVRRRRWTRRTWWCSWSTRGPASPRRTRTSPPGCAARAARCCWWPTRRRAAAGPQAALEAFSLGLGEPLAVSAEHGDGLADLMGEIADRLPEPREEDELNRPLHLAIVGRPNAGKSTLLNRLLGEERMITGPEPGLTRDAVAVRLRGPGRPDRAGGYRRAAAEGADRGGAREDEHVGHDRGAQDGRDRRAVRGRAGGAARAGPADRAPDRAGGPRLRAGAEQVGRGARPQRRAQGRHGPAADQPGADARDRGRDAVGDDRRRRGQAAARGAPGAARCGTRGCPREN